MGSLTAPNLTLTTGQISNGGLLQGSYQLSLHAGQLDNLAAGTISSDNDFALDLPQLNNSGLITSGKTLVVSGDQLNNSGKSTLPASAPGTGIWIISWVANCWPVTHSSCTAMY